MTVHPLEPAAASELSEAVELLRAAEALSDRAFFTFGHRVEPGRDALRQARDGGAVERIISLVGHDPSRGKSFDTRVSIGGHKTLPI